MSSSRSKIMKYIEFDETFGSILKDLIQVGSTEDLFLINLGDYSLLLDTYQLIDLVTRRYIQLIYMRSTSSSKLKKSELSQEEEIYNEMIPGSQEKGYSAIYRQKGLKAPLSIADPDIRTVRDILDQCNRKYGDKNGFGQVLVNTQKNQKGEDVESRVVIDYTYRHIYENAMRLGRALHDRQMAKKETERGMNLIGIFSRNRLEWYVADWACILFGYVFTPLYDTLGKQNLAHCIQQSGIITLFVSAKTAADIYKFHQKGNLRNLILFDEIDEELSNNLRKEGLQLFNYWQLIEEGSKSKTTNQNIKIHPDDIYSFCYSSGTTGAPKAALISHANMVTSTVGFISHKEISMEPSDVYLSYLPLPHLMERSVTLSAFYKGAQVIVSSGNPLKLKEDCAATKTSVLISVPRLYNRIVDGVKTTISTMVTDESKRQQIQHVVFQKVRQSFGGKIRIMASGSAPLNPSVHQYIQRVMDCPLIEGYGQTESPTAILFSRPTKTKFGMLQQLSVGSEVRLMDIPEMRYTADDKDSQGRPTPRGEVCLRGPQVFQGYYKLPEITRETIDAEGWLHTGDVAMITPQLAFKIIDRKKNIFKLQQGEYVAPDTVENVYMRSGLVEQIFLHGQSSQNFAVAIVTPKKDKLAQIINQLHAVGSVEEASQQVQVRTQYLFELNAFAKNQGLFGYQLAKNIHFELVGFITRGILTNTMKLIRFEGRRVYKEAITAMYQEGELKM